MDLAIAGQCFPERENVDPKQCTARGGEKRGEEKARKAEEAKGRGGQAPKGKGGREEPKAAGRGNDAKRLFGLSSQYRIL